LLSLLLPKIGLYTIDVSALSRDRAVVAAYVADPLVYRGKVRARLGAELVKTVKMLPSQIPRINLPILIMHGAADRLSPPEGSQILYERVGSKDKTLKLYRDFYHEIFNEPGNMQVFADMESWLAAHI
jgi:alpha-beta hydrolase superfamily lysophospholipase